MDTIVVARGYVESSSGTEVLHSALDEAIRRATEESEQFLFRLGDGGSLRTQRASPLVPRGR
ncbi:MAG: hypothetical protein ACOC25_04900 [Alkalispirochaetaceae bacterium]